MKEIYTQIKAYIDSQRDEMFSLYRKIINIDSGSRNIEGVNRVCAILREEMDNAGIRTRVIEMPNAGNILIGEWNFDKSDKKPLVFIGHMDTVFPDGTVEKNPFRVDGDGKVHGPGCLDMKPGLIIGLYAVKALAAVGYESRPVRFIYVGDEENLHMYSDAAAVIKEEAKGALAAFNF
jgi:glutamate carboxypeptidase